MLDYQAIIKYNNSILVSINNGMKMNKDQKLDHMVALMEEINIIEETQEESFVVPYFAKEDSEYSSSCLS